MKLKITEVYDKQSSRDRVLENPILNSGPPDKNPHPPPKKNVWF